MSAYAQLLTQRYQGKLDADADQFGAMIVRASVRMSALVRDLLAYVRLATKEERPSPTALDEDLEAALTHLDQAIEEVDRGQMVRLFQNLVGNAVKYRKPDRPCKVHITGNKKGQNGSSQYVTTGSASIPSTRRLFCAVSSACTRPRNIPEPALAWQFAGVSLQAQGGRIWAESEPGEGTTFFFTLPAERPQLKLSRSD